jgi:hypothetical protein
LFLASLVNTKFLEFHWNPAEIFFIAPGYSVSSPTSPSSTTSYISLTKLAEEINRRQNITVLWPWTTARGASSPPCPPTCSAKCWPITWSSTTYVLRCRQAQGNQGQVRHAVPVLRPGHRPHGLPQSHQACRRRRGVSALPSPTPRWRHTY